MPNTTSPPLTLYSHPVSSYAQKIRIALREKSLPFTAILPLTLSTGGADPTFQSANPRLEVPTLIDPDGDVQIFDSTIILEYIEDKWPSPPLLPSPQEPGAAAARANARMIEDVCDTTYEAINWAWGEVLWMGRASGNLQEQLRREAERQTREIQSWLEGKLGAHEFFGGGSGFGWADVCAAPIVNRSDYFGWGPREGSALAKWLERVRRRESVRVTFQEFADAVGGMSAMRGKYESGERRREYRDHRLEWMVKSGGIEVGREGLERRNVRFQWPEAKV
jgi:glutathione S-transferase